MIATVDRRGPSPRVRGSRSGTDPAISCIGSIPACAGKPVSGFSRSAKARVHPRVCGEALPRVGFQSVATGPSPRVRGSRVDLGDDLIRAGSIPACAGKPLAAACAARSGEVHPRVCGEAGTGFFLTPFSPGPSPRVRGSPVKVSTCAHPAGSIPACAGKPQAAAADARMAAVHPRVCGEAPRLFPLLRPYHGPSPRVRGSRRCASPSGARPGSIPACAGKPDAFVAGSAVSRVHPRVCGEAPASSATCAPSAGPSPRVRGSHAVHWRIYTPGGSIPACAGKPETLRGSRCHQWVHPRVCGEASMAEYADREKQGPSPRVRGSPTAALAGRGHHGSIPACAGKPNGRTCRPRSPRVHPRVCGEAVR